jgi:DNA-binding Lrp family transcriptional regulator
MALVAKVLLDYAEYSITERRQLTQRDIAVLVGTDWETVHSSLKSLQEEGTIRIERHRIIINKESLQKVAGIAGRVKSGGSEMAEIKRITIDEVKKRMDRGESILFIDTRNPQDSAGQYRLHA